MHAVAGRQCAGGFQGMEAVACELVRSDIAAEVPCLCSRPKQIRHEFNEVLLSPPDMCALMQPCRVGTAVAGVGHQGISLQNGFKLPGRTGAAVPDPGQLLQVGVDLAFVPCRENGVHIRKVLVQGRPSDACRLGDLRHRHRGQAVPGHQRSCRVQNGGPHGTAVRLDGLIPQLRHHHNIQPGAY